MDILLVRHAESDSNIGILYDEWGAAPLTNNGNNLARQFSQSILTQPSLLISSSYLRALQTAGHILNRFPEIKLEEWQVEEFSFLSPIKVKGKSEEERSHQVIDYWNRCDPLYNDGDGAESFSDLMLRVSNFIEKLSTLNYKNIIVISHHDFIKATLWKFLFHIKRPTGDAMKNYRHFRTCFALPNLASIKLRYVNGEFWLAMPAFYHQKTLNPPNS